MVRIVVFRGYNTSNNKEHMKPKTKLLSKDVVFDETKKIRARCKMFLSTLTKICKSISMLSEKKIKTFDYNFKNADVLVVEAAL